MNLILLLTLLLQDGPVVEKKLLTSVTPDQIQHLQYSPAGGAVAHSDGRAVRVNDQRGEEVPIVERGTLRFAADGTVGYIVGDPKRHWVVVDGKKGEVCDHIRQFRFSPRGKGFAYVAVEKGKEAVVHNGVKGETFDRIGPLVSLSDDGSVVAYAAHLDRKNWVILGTRRTEALGPVYSLAIQPDGSAMAYVVEEGRRRQYAAFNGKKGEVFEHVPWVAFAPSGEIVHEGIRDKKNVLVVGERPFEVDGRLGMFAFAADGRTPVFAFDKDGKQHLAVGTQVSGPYHAIVGPLRHPSGKGYAVGLRESTEKAWVIVNDQKQEEFREVGFLDFSPDGATVAYLAKKAPKEQVVVVGSRKLPCPANVTPKALNGGKVAWTIFGPLRMSVAVEGGAAGEEFDSIQMPLIVLGDKSFGYYAFKHASKDTQIFWVTVKAP